MPILACIGMSLLVYMVLFYSLKKDKAEIGSEEMGIVFLETNREECQGCGKTYHGNWRYCPYCGEPRENG